MPCVLFLFGGFLVSAAAMAVPYAATGITLHVMGVVTLDGPGRTSAVFEPQVSNRLLKRDRVALLNDSPSYTNFDSSSLELALSHLPTQDGVNGLLSHAQIDRIASRLRLTQQQLQKWPAVAAALEEVGRRYFQTSGGIRALRLNTSELKRLIEAAIPFIAELNSEQKREVRQLMRIIGLEKVAGEI